MMTDRRSNGLSVAEFPNNNGQKIHIVTLNLDKAKLWAYLVLASFGILVALTGVVRFGVQLAVEHAIKTETQPPVGIIYREMHITAQEAFKEAVKPVQEDVEALDKELDIVRGTLTHIQVNQENIKKDADEQRERLLRSLQEKK